MSQIVSGLETSAVAAVEPAIETAAENAVAKLNSSPAVNAAVKTWVDATLNLGSLLAAPILTNGLTALATKFGVTLPASL